MIRTAAHARRPADYLRDGSPPSRSHASPPRAHQQTPPRADRLRMRDLTPPPPFLWGRMAAVVGVGT
eukprot:2592554-Prymnesium_polylepis.1